MSQLTDQPPAFQFYVDDFLGGTDDFTQAETGAYVLLLCHQWNKGSVPKDFERLKIIAKGDVTEHVMAKFEKHGERLRNLRLEKVRAAQKEFRKNRSEAGKIGAERRWHSHSTAMAQPLANSMAKNGSPSPTPVSIKEKFNSLGELEKSEKRFIEACELLFGEKAMKNWGGKWRNNYRKNKANACSVLRQVCEGVFEGAITRNPSGYADKLWREYK